MKGSTKQVKSNPQKKGRKTHIKLKRKAFRIKAQGHVCDPSIRGSNKTKSQKKGKEVHVKASNERRLRKGVWVCAKSSSRRLQGKKGQQNIREQLGASKGRNHGIPQKGRQVLGKKGMQA